MSKGFYTVCSKKFFGGKGVFFCFGVVCVVLSVVQEGVVYRQVLGAVSVSGI